MSESPNRIMVKDEVSRTYVIRMSRLITEADDFEEEFQVLACAGPSDIVKIIINSDGGNLATSLLLCKAIRECEAHTVAYIGMFCASAATLIALACTEWEIDENSSFMVHTATYGVYGKAQEVSVQARHMDKMVKRLMFSSYTGFLSQEEIQGVIDGKDIWLEGEELLLRLSSFGEYRQALSDATALDTQQESA